MQRLDESTLPHAVSSADAILLLERALAAGNAGLALSIYQQLCIARQRAQAPWQSQAALGGAAALPGWPAATLAHTTTLVLGLCRQLRVADALAAVAGMRGHGVGVGEAEMSFGHVVSSPLPPGRPLAVVQPQEGCRVVADANSRYEFELYSGAISSVSSTALQPGANPLLSAARAVGLWRRAPVAAVHELVVEAPDGGSRAFRVGTASADVPARVGERVTLVCAPARGSNRARRLLLSTSPPGTQPGQAMLVSNHATGVELPLLQPPLPGAQTAGVPGWVLPAAVLLAGGDAASALLDPALPLLIAGGVAATAGGALASGTLLLPKLKQLPPSAVKLEEIRQQLLAQHAGLDARFKSTSVEAAEDVRTLARLCQLQAKMQSVDGGADGGVGTTATSAAGASGVGNAAATASTYQARMARVAAAAAGLEARLTKRLELLEGYARVMNMIEIEVEMDLQVPVAELEGLGAEIEKLSELESIREEWQAQAEAQDEVRRCSHEHTRVVCYPNCLLLSHLPPALATAPPCCMAGRAPPSRLIGGITMLRRGCPA